jgi:integrase/recombinase XerD
MLTQAMLDYVELRQAGGFKFEGQQVLLRSFVQFAADRGEQYIGSQSAIDWAALGTSPNHRETRLRTVVAFARYCRGEDQAHELPPIGVFGTGRHRRPVAYVFSRHEIGLILTEAQELGPKASLRPLALYTLFGLLASSGLRIGEALRLRFHDLSASGLLVRESKFKKSREVPLHTTTLTALARYLSLRKQLGGDSEHVFVSIDGTPLQAQSVRDAFLQIVHKIGLANARYGKPPRLHDFRHTWAVRALEASPLRAGDVDRHSRAVSTYLGHTSVASTYCYLHTTPILMKGIADACATREEGGAP